MSTISDGCVPSASPLGRREKRKQTNRARNRLLSIRHDATSLSQTLHMIQFERRGHAIPILGNERCGTWYIDTRTTPMHDTCYFKSSDGHTNTWNCSLKRLNLNVIRIVAAAGACVIVDASASKDMPDSLSRTIPIWACVMNRLTARYREELAEDTTTLPEVDGWDTSLYTPPRCVPPEEHAKMEAIIDERVWAMYESKAIVDPPWLVQALRKPLKPTWILSNSVAAAASVDRSSGEVAQPLPSADVDDSSSKYFSLLLVSCSDPHHPSKTPSFRYSPGAGDDHETWARGLTPALFWSHHEELLDSVEATADEDCLDATDAAMDRLVAAESTSTTPDLSLVNAPPVFDMIRELGLAIGSRRAGRPPDCWASFDAVLNVTEQSYDDMMDDTNGKYYLQLPVREGKRDKIELERWMSVGIVFVALHASQGRRILIHCAQGMDRSVALAMASILVLCNSLTLPLQWRTSVLVAIRDQFGTTPSIEDCDGKAQMYGSSGMTQEVVDSLLGQQGRDTFLSFVRNELGSEIIPANKETLRLALLLIQQDREKSDPSRSTMQKLNRYFMSQIMFSP